MGNNASIGITFDNAPARAGTEVTGRIFAETDKKIKAEKIAGVITGEEKCCVSSVKGKLHATRSLLDMKVEFPPFENGELLPGKYEFPFLINLPKEIPGSMRFEKSDKRWCEIKYKMKAQLVGSGTFSDYSAEEAFQVISSPISPESSTLLVEPISKKVKFAGCLKKGYITLGANVDRSVIGKGQEVTVSLACLNDTTVPIDGVKVRVYEVISWQAGDYPESETKLLVDRDAHDLLSTGGSLVRKSVDEVNEYNILSQQQNNKEILNEILAKKRCITIKIPPEALDSYAGQAVSCKHMIRIKAKTGVLLKSPYIEVPLKIGLPSESAPATNERKLIAMLGQSSTRLPADWSGAVEAPVALVPQESVILGGMSFDNENGDTPETRSSASPAFEKLIFEIKKSVNALELVERNINAPEWKDVFVSLSPPEFGQVVSHVDDFDQPAVAAIIAPCIDNGNFTCEHCAAAVRSTADWNRTAMVQRLLPFCKDLHSGQNYIKNELSQWEMTVIENQLSDALQLSQ